MKKCINLLFGIICVYAANAQTDVNYLRTKDSINLGGQVFNSANIRKWNLGTRDTIAGSSAQFVKGDGSLDNNSYAFWDNVNGLFAAGTWAGFGVSAQSGQAVNGNFIGTYSGYLATYANNTNFLGNNGGFGATNANNSNFLGQSSGYLAVNANNSNFLGYYAGFGATSANSSNFLGSNAGYNSTAANNSNFLGNYAGFVAPNASNSNFLGLSAGYTATNASNSNFLGNYAGFSSTNATNANFFGPNAGYNSASANNSNFFGSSAGNSTTNANNSNFFGNNAGSGATSAANSNFLGQFAGYLATAAANSNLFGFQVGKTIGGTGLGANNIIIGTNISLPDATANAINIGGILFGTGTYSNLTTQSKTPIATGKIGIGVVNPATTLDVNGTAQATQFKLSALNTAPATSTSTGVLGEIRIVNGFIYVCVATNSWKRTALTTF